MMAACEAQARATSSNASTYPTASPPAPPKASGMATPIKPSSPMRRTVSRGKRASRSIASAMGRTSFSAKSRATCWIIRCSSVSSICMALCPDSMDRSVLSPALFLQKLLELLLQERRHLEQIAHDAVVGDLEDGRLGILVDGADHLRRPHPRQVLDGPRDAEAQVELGRDGAPRLADLETMRPPPRVHRGARGAHGGPDDLGERLQDHEVLRPLEAAPARDHDLRLGQLGQARSRLLAPLDQAHGGAGES